MYSIPRREGSEGENGDKEEGGSRSISRPVVRERRPAMLCATFGTKQTAEIEWKEKRSKDTLLTWSNKFRLSLLFVLFVRRRISSRFSRFSFATFKSSSTNSLLFSTLSRGYSTTEHYSANSIVSRIKSRKKRTKNKRILRSQKEKKEKNRNYRFSSPIFSISRD